MERTGRWVLAALLSAASAAAPAVEPPSQGAVPSATHAQALRALESQRQQALAENSLIGQSNQAVAAKDWPEAESLAQQLIQLAPDRWQYRKALADAQFNQGKYAAALASYTTALDQAGKGGSDPQKLRSAKAAMYTNQGNCYLKLKRNDEAIAAYNRAAALDPNPAVAYFNICATQYNVGNVAGALNACDKAIAADPAKADAYFIKGSLLMGDAKPGPNNTYMAPPGTVEALQMYLKLEPKGPHAADVQQMLDFLNGKAP